MAGALLQEGIDVAVILNALRALGGGAGPRPLKDRGAVDRLVDEHRRLRTLLDRMRSTAERLGGWEPHMIEELAAIDAELTELLLPHQREEERSLFPALAERLGGHDPLGTMNRMHDEIAHESKRFSMLVAGMSDVAGSRSEAEEARRLLHVLEALIALHLTTEEELVSAVEDLPAQR